MVLGCQTTLNQMIHRLIFLALISHDVYNF